MTAMHEDTVYTLVASRQASCWATSPQVVELFGPGEHPKRASQASLFVCLRPPRRPATQPAPPSISLAASEPEEAAPEKSRGGMGKERNGDRIEEVIAILHESLKSGAESLPPDWCCATSSQERESAGGWRRPGTAWDASPASLCPSESR
eukprot:scaffold57_cov254-Pinguiococcus_pyrenoidosus.AAC.17